jgi:hypothetical protein
MADFPLKGASLAADGQLGITDSGTEQEVTPYPHVQFGAAEVPQYSYHADFRAGRNQGAIKSTAARRGSPAALGRYRLFLPVRAPLTPRCSWLEQGTLPWPRPLPLRPQAEL